MHVTRAVLEQFLAFSKYLNGLTHGAPLLKQLCDHILFNAAIWIHIPAKVSKVMSFPEDTQVCLNETRQQLGASEYTVMGCSDLVRWAQGDICWSKHEAER